MTAPKKPATEAQSQHSDGGGERQVPFFCPYCGEETLRPAGADAGGWTCESCTRTFTLRLGVSPEAGR
jgi:ribosomal protein L37AE/L43A